MLATLEDLRVVAARVLGSDGEGPDRTMLFETVAAMLRALAAMRDPSRGPSWIDTAAWDLGWALIDLHNRWSSGDVVTVDEALGWQRPKNWQRPAAQRRAALRSRAFFAAERLINEGKGTEEAFIRVSKDKEFPVSAATVRNWYYELAPLLSKRFAKRL